MRILVVEDERRVASIVTRALRENAYEVDLAETGEKAIALATQNAYDSILLDVRLPGLSGIQVCQRLRTAHIDTPILMLTARTLIEQRVEGLDAGADDYLTKPFAFSELVARLEALTRRRAPTAAETRLAVGDLEMDLLSRTVKRAGQAIELQPREFRLLEYLMRHAGQVVTRTMLLEGVWDYHFDPQTNVIDVHISRLRQKIDKGFATPLLHTMRGAGYCLRADS